MKTYVITFRTAFGSLRNVMLECSSDQDACNKASNSKQDGEVITYVGMV